MRGKAISSGLAILLGQSLAEQFLEVGQPLRVLAHLQHNQDVFALDILLHRQSQAVAALPAPPLPFCRRVLGLLEHLQPVPLQVQERQQASVHPSFHLLEPLELVVRQAKDRFTLLEKEFDLPSKIINLNNIFDAAFQVVAQQDLLHLDRLSLVDRLARREEHSCLAHVVDIAVLLMHPVGAGLGFWPHPASGCAALCHIWPLPRRESYRDILLGCAILCQQLDLGPRFWPGQATVVGHWHYPLELAARAGRLDRLGVESGVTNHHYTRLLGHAQLVDQAGSNLRLGTIRPAVLGTIVLGVVGQPDWQTQSAGSQQQPHDEAVAVALLLLLAFLAFILGFMLLASAAVGSAVRALQTGALVAAIGLVEQEQPGPFLGFLHEQIAKESLEPVSRNSAGQASQKADDVAPVAFLPAHAGGDESGTETTFGQHAGQDN